MVVCAVGVEENKIKCLRSAGQPFDRWTIIIYVASTLIVHRFVSSVFTWIFLGKKSKGCRNQCAGSSAENTMT